MLRLSVSDRLGEHVQGAYGVLPVDDPLPASYVARTGECLVPPTRESWLAFTPKMGPLYEATKRYAWMFTPLKVGNRLLGALAVCWVDEPQFTDDELTVVDAFGAQCAQALDRICIAQAQRESALQVARLAEGPAAQPSHAVTDASRARHRVPRRQPRPAPRSRPGHRPGRRVTYLPDGSTPLLYTDGLVERRDESLDDGLRRLSMALAAAGDARPEEVCDRLLHAMLPEAPETTSRCSCCARTQSPRRVIPDGSIRTHAEAQT